MEAYELHRGNYVTYNGITVKFISFIDETRKKCMVQYPDGKTKNVNINKLYFIMVDEEFLLKNGFHHCSLTQYPDMYYYKTTIEKDGFTIIYHTYINGMCVSSIKIMDPQNITIETIGDGSVNHFQNIITLSGHTEVIKDLKIKKTYGVLDESEWISF